MNIFYLDSDPRICAQMHNDKHCVKMILEYAQLLSTAHRVIDGVLTVGVSDSGRKKRLIDFLTNVIIFYILLLISIIPLQSGFDSLIKIMTGSLIYFKSLWPNILTATEKSMLVLN